MSLAEHELRGTVRADRHLRPVPLAPAALARTARRRLLAGLGDEGRRFAAAMADRYGDWSPGDLALLRRAAETEDRLAALTAAIAADGAVVAAGRAGKREHALAARVRAELRTLALLLRSLRIEVK
jgi:hypothetical protein